MSYAANVSYTDTGRETLCHVEYTKRPFLHIRILAYKLGPPRPNLYARSKFPSQYKYSVSSVWSVRIYRIEIYITNVDVLYELIATVTIIIRILGQFVTKVLS